MRSLRLLEKKAESRDVTSFVFGARDGGPLADFRAGQHLPLEIALGDGRRASRSYSLSNAPGQGRYRISVKRHEQGLVSRLLHERLEVGGVVDARPPAGDFVLPEGDGPLVLASAGVGLTPLVSMLHALADAGDAREIWFVHGARDGDHHPLAGEVEALVSRLPNAHLHVAYSRSRAGDDGHGSRGRVDAALLDRLLPELRRADFYLCGPPGFLGAVQSGLEARGVPPGRIHHESF